jgi:acyl-CoA thioester hydrolase
MITYTHELRVAYADTDQMGYVYYGNYARYFEIARTEALRSIGISYAKMESEGTMMPVTNYSVKYVKAALYDEVIAITVSINEIPDRFLVFHYQAENKRHEKLCEAEIRLAFVDSKTMKISRAPKYLVDAIKEKLV